jgi:multiple sugar transport system substrate-binding protein
MKRRWLFISVMSLLLLSLVLGACSSGTPAPSDADTPAEEEPAAEEEAEPIDLKMTIWGSESDPEVYQARLDLFQAENPNINVEIVYIPSDYAQKVQTMIAGGTPPDIMQLAEDVHGYSSKGQVLSLTPYLEQYDVDLDARYGGSGLVEAYSWGEDLYAMPDRGGALIMYYNKDMFDAAGIDYPTQAWTWDDFLKAAEAMTIREGGDVVQYGFAAGDWWPWWMSFIYQNGGRLIDENGNPTVNTPEVVEALEFYTDLMYEYEVAPTPEDYANLGVNSPDPLFAQGKVAMITTGFWNVGSLQEVEDINWDIAPIFQNEERATVAFGSGLAVSADTEYPEAAFKVVEFLTSEAGQMPIIEMKQDMPTNIQALNSETFKETQWSATPIRMETMAESAEAVFPLPLIPEWNEMLDVFGDNLSEVFLGQTEVAPTVETIQAQLEELLAE